MDRVTGQNVTARRILGLMDATNHVVVKVDDDVWLSGDAGSALDMLNEDVLNSEVESIRTEDDALVIWVNN